MRLYQGDILLRTRIHAGTVAKVSSFFSLLIGAAERAFFFSFLSFFFFFFFFFFLICWYPSHFLANYHTFVVVIFLSACKCVCVCVRARAFLLSFFNNPIWLLYILQLASRALFCNIVNTMTINNKGFGKRIVRPVCRFSSSLKSDYILFIYLIDVQE